MHIIMIIIIITRTVGGVASRLMVDDKRRLSSQSVWGPFLLIEIMSFIFPLRGFSFGRAKVTYKVEHRVRRATLLSLTQT